MTRVPLPDPLPGMRWLFDRLAARDETRTALIGVNRAWSAGELRAAVETCAAELFRCLAVTRPGAPLALASPRSRADAVVALLSVWRLGLVPVLGDEHGARTPDGARVEPPVLRPADSAALGPRAVAGNDTGLEVLGQPWALTGTATGTPLPCARPAYVIATSGSTGPPAPVLNHADGLRNTVTALVERYRLSVDSRALLFAPFGYDAVLADLLPALLAGGAVVCCDDGSWQRASALAARMRSTGVTHAVLPPSVWRVVLSVWKAAGIRLETLVSAGEPLDTALAAELAGLARAVVNAYGPSEAAVCVTTFEAGPETTAGAARTADPVPIPVGRPLPGIMVEVVDEAGVRVGPGATGRIIVRGAGVAHGYLAPVGGQTRGERFQPRGPAFGPCPPQTLHTGDIGTLTDGGDLVVVGREDDETKLHGRRIRLTAIEAALRTLPDVRDAAVTVHDDRLHCVWVPLPADSTADAPDRADALPPPTPSVWHRVPAVPVTTSDKIDRAAVLRQVTASAKTGMDSGGAPTRTSPPVPHAGGGAVDTIVGRLWRRHTSGTGEPDEDFFAVGGDSLRAMELLDDIETETGHWVDLADFLDAPTMGQLTGLLRSTEPSSTPPGPAGRETP
ncbi:non-ribosomal peptide synthetase [Streptomyces echinatus]|uniref:non-ribosomal peptide synthetase n=1 Tax=Streptomyces echinatus TaxID=67293 RepID=UPI0037BCA835